MMEGVRFDYGNMMAPRLNGGVTEDALGGAFAERFRAAHARFESRKGAGELGFLELPYAAEAVEQVRELADGYGQWFEDVVVLGIGGSGLGPIALRDALLGPFWNQLGAEERDHFPRLHIVDNPDPFTFRGLLERVDPARTLFNVISKSGTTAETMAQYLVARHRVEEAVGPDKARGHFLFTTDPVDGVLRRLSDAEGIPALAIPENVGGRFSVLSPVGLLPAAICGIDPDRLLAGAARMLERCATPELVDNPAGLFATLLHDADTARDRRIHVLMPYADRLRSLASWFQQLWAESLAKALREDGTVRPTGPTPLAALGATDQHSLLQLLIEGPDDKVVVFVDVEDTEAEVEIPGRHPEIPALAYLGGHTLGELLATERKATAEALRQQGRPNATFTVPSVSPEALGEMMMLFQIATVYGGALYGVDPLDQPGVEHSKKLTYGLMGRDGVDAPDITPPDPRWIV